MNAIIYQQLFHSRYRSLQTLLIKNGLLSVGYSLPFILKAWHVSFDLNVNMQGAQLMSLLPPLFVMRSAKGLGVDRKLLASKDNGTGSFPFSMEIPLEFKRKKKEKKKNRNSSQENVILFIVYCTVFRSL